MDLLLGIDLGSTSIKTILYDLDGQVAARASRPMQRFHPNPEHPEWTVWDPDELWSQTATACRDIVSQIADPAAIKGIATTGMGMDGLPMGEHGERLYPLISWHDPRTSPQFDWWLENITAAKTFSIGGNPVWAINSALRMLWMKENEPEIFRSACKWLLIEDYINYRLSGVFATDQSMASCTMLFDQKERTWSEEMCRLSGIPVSLLPPVMPSATRMGEVTNEAAAETGLRVGTPVFLGGHDHICSSLPVGAFRPGTVLCITGTWEMIDMVASTPPLDPVLGASGLTTQAHVIPNCYMLWGGNPAGEVLEWYRREMLIPPGESGESDVAGTVEWDVIIREAASAKPGCGGTMFLPHLGGSSCPKVDPRSLGTWVGLSSRTTRADAIRSLFEGLGYQLLDVIATMEEGSGRKASEVIAVGGAIRNKFWMQNKADMLGVRVRVPDVDEATVLGAAILAGIGAGLFSDAEDAFVRFKHDSVYYDPDENLTRFYREMFPMYRELYASVRSVNHRLFDRFLS
ncbi:MAG: FGGY family carbohydrate kinase [Planctomycetaceae bacterium]|nr:FGGY family carbohydrate kinase [Planctomycetaceae bacterium]